MTNVFTRLVQRLTGPEAPATLDELPIWMHPIEISQLWAALEALAPRRVLEWGAGGSTRALLEGCESITRYVSIEHNPHWFAKIRDKVDDPRLELYLVEAIEDEPQPLTDGASEARAQRNREIVAWRARAEVEPALMADYVAKPTTVEDPEFDLVLVDGRARAFCIRQGFELLRPGGTLVLHDAQRSEYHQALHAVGRPVFLEPWEQGQLCLVRKPDHDLASRAR